LATRSVHVAVLAVVGSMFVFREVAIQASP
jgi:hypothetical protein